MKSDAASGTSFDPGTASDSPLSRRRFVGVLGAAATVAATGAAWVMGRVFGVRESTSETRTRLAMVIDLDRCIGCQACAVACKAEHGVRLGGFRSWVSQKEVSTPSSVTRLFLPRLCNHCENPPCLAVCPTGATYKRDDGLVDIDKSRCIGCRHCMEACPYGSRYFNPTGSPDEQAFPALTHGTVDKCDFCAHRIDRGVVPACVNTCLAGARIFGDLNDPDGEVRRLVSEDAAQPLLPEFGTGPSVFYKGGDPEEFREA